MKLHQVLFFSFLVSLAIAIVFVATISLSKHLGKQELQTRIFNSFYRYKTEGDGLKLIDCTSNHKVIMTLSKDSLIFTLPLEQKISYRTIHAVQDSVIYAEWFGKVYTFLYTPDRRALMFKPSDRMLFILALDKDCR